MHSIDLPRARFATRAGFLAAGFGLAGWAPLVPFAKARLGVDDAVLGLLLLCLGIGSVVAMALTGALSARHGARPIILVSGLLMAAATPFLAIASTPLALGAVLFVFGAGLGSLDVAINIHAVDVEKAGERPMMSGFHALFSIGGFAGAGAVTALLSFGATPVFCAVFCAVVVGAATLIAWPGLMKVKAGADAPLFAVPRGVVLLLAVLAAVTFLAEGAVLDWSALLISETGMAPVEQGGLGYIIFAIAMTSGRLVGDAVTARLGDFRVLLWGGVTALAGFGVLLLSPVPAIAFGGFALIGLGASNLVPVLFRRAGSQTVMPSGLAVAAITTTGYAGILVGPAAMGFVAHAVGLTTAFWLIAALVAMVPLCAGLATRNR